MKAVCSRALSIAACEAYRYDPSLAARELETGGWTRGADGQLLNAADLPSLPLYFRPTYIAVRKGVEGPGDDYAATTWAGSMPRNIHLWQIE